MDVNGKTEFGQRFDLLGVSLDCVSGRLEMKLTRKDNLEAELRAILREGRLAPGAAAKLRGKLQFVAGHFAGRHGRAFLAPFAERQHSSSKDCTLSRSLDGAVRSWLHILASDLRPRSLYAPVVPETADVVLFTDGACPDAREWLRDTTLPCLGLAFWKNYRGAKERVFFHNWVVTLEAMAEWEARQTQVSMVELLATVSALEWVCPKAQGKRVTLLVDSEAIEAAIVKGTSSAADHLDLIAILWDVVTYWDVALYVSRVPTDSNPSDGASRGRFESLESRGACWVDTALSRFALSRARWHEELRHRACRNEQNMPASTVTHRLDILTV